MCSRVICGFKVERALSSEGLSPLVSFVFQVERAQGVSGRLTVRWKLFLCYVPCVHVSSWQLTVLLGM